MNPRNFSPGHSVRQSHTGTKAYYMKSTSKVKSIGAGANNGQAKSTVLGAARGHQLFG